MKRNYKLVFAALLLISVFYVAYKSITSMNIRDWQVTNAKSELVFSDYLVPKLALLKQIETEPFSLYLYKKALVKLAEKKGISSKELIDVLTVVDKERPKVKFPVLIESGKYKGAKVYFVLSQFDIEKGGIYGLLSKLVNPPSEEHHHYSLVIVEKATKKIMYSRY